MMTIDADYKSHMSLYPAVCELCPAEDRRVWGCGCEFGIPWTATASGESYAGQADADYHGADIDDVEARRTCPQWFARSPAVLSILDELDDYEAGRLPWHDLGAAELFYLRVALAERRAWEAHWKHELARQARSRSS